VKSKNTQEKRSHVTKWSWQKNYRVWEANRKEFIYPENWVEPNLQDNKGKLFDELEKKLLRQITTKVTQHVRDREALELPSPEEGGGVTVIFAGGSTRGKAIVVETLAKEMRLDLYRIDLSAIVSKYIGETEKNLRKLFDAAEHTRAMLFFDEADALFGKRTQVKDSHDRYANIKLNYLLELIESYHGLTILAMNMTKELDPHVLRRIGLVVIFPSQD